MTELLKPTIPQIYESELARFASFLEKPTSQIQSYWNTVAPNIAYSSQAANRFATLVCPRTIDDYMARHSMKSSTEILLKKNTHDTIFKTVSGPKTFSLSLAGLLGDLARKLYGSPMSINDNTNRLHFKQSIHNAFFPDRTLSSNVSISFHFNLTEIQIVWNVMDNQDDDRRQTPLIQVRIKGKQARVQREDSNPAPESFQLLKFPPPNPGFYSIWEFQPILASSKVMKDSKILKEFLVNPGHKFAPKAIFNHLSSFLGCDPGRVIPEVYANLAGKTVVRKVGDVTLNVAKHKTGAALKVSHSPASTSRRKKQSRVAKHSKRSGKDPLSLVDKTETPIIFYGGGFKATDTVSEIHHLVSRGAIVILVHEMLTSQMCPFWFHHVDSSLIPTQRPNLYGLWKNPRMGASSLVDNQVRSVVCKEPGCPGRNVFMNRDHRAALTIAHVGIFMLLFGYHPFFSMAKRR